MSLARYAAAGLAVLLCPLAARAQISDNVVKIGILNDQSGVYADFGGKWSVEAARMAVEDARGQDHREVLVELVNADHQNKPDIASNIARQWYDVDKVDVIMELTTSSVALAVQQLSREKKKIDIVTGAATTDLTGKQCSPYGFHWAYDTRALAVGTGGALVEQGGDTWFFLTADYAFGYSLEEETARYVKSKGGKVLGAVRHPLSASDFSSFLLQAQGSKAKVIGLANAGLDTSTPSSPPPSSAWCRVGSASRRSSSPSPKSTASASRPRRASCSRRAITGTSTTRAAGSPSASWSAPDACRI